MVGLCRLCASLRKIDVLTIVKDNSSEICDKLRKCCQLDITIDDGLPKSICQECISHLNNSHIFYTKVQEAQETLQALYPSQVNKTVRNSLQQYLQAYDEIDRFPTKPAETDAAKEYKNIENSSQHIKLANNLFKESKNNPNKLSTRKAEEVGQIEKSAPELKVSEDSCETIQNIEDLKEGGKELQGPHADSVDDLYQEDLAEEPNLKYSEDQYDLDFAEENDSQPNESVQQLNDLSSDDDLNLEIEYMEYLEDEEEDTCVNKDIDETFENARQHLNNPDLSHELKINSWKEYKHICFICDSIFPSFIDLKIHIAEEHSITSLDNIKYKCYDCRKIIARYSFFLNHVRAVHHPDLKLKCDACDLSFKNFNELKIHRSAGCVEAKNFMNSTQCNYCFKSFNNTYGLQNHIKFQHISLTKIVYKCELCDKTFQYKNCLKSHKRLHSDIKLFACDYCDKSFHNKLGLEQHLYTHIEEKSYPCNICNKSYKTFQSLAEHKTLHTKEKHFKCQFCIKVFKRKIQKITHERSHTGEMPYSCEQCDKKFRYRSALFVHSKVHSGRKPYSCDYCTKTFADSSNRNKHVRRIHLKDKMLENKIE